MKDILCRSVTELACGLENLEFSAEELTRAYLGRIKEKDAEIGAFLTVAEESAIEAARESDKRRAEGKVLGSLDGIPISVKDNICTRGIFTTCASRMLEGYIPPYDATAVDRLKAAGAIILGKTNMDEFGMGSSCENSAYKITKNPLDTSCVAGGSSGGSAAAVAASMSPLALGSDTGGSVRQPASFCGLVGMKPTYGRVPRYGLVAFASSLDQIGVISSSVEDNATVLGVISGRDARDSTTADIPSGLEGVSKKEGVRGLSVAIPRELISSEVSDEVRTAVLAAAHIYERLGASVKEISLPSLRYALPAYYVISSAEASSNLARFDGVRYGRRAEGYGDINELYIRSRSEGFGDEVKRRIMLGTFALSAGYYDEYYGRAKRAAESVRCELEESFEEFDLLLSPTSPGTAFRIGEMTDSPTRMYASDLCTVPASIAGIPALSLPCGVDGRGMPIGVQLMGRVFSEDMLYRAAFALERETGGAK